MDLIVVALLSVFVMVLCVCCFMGLLAFVMVLIVSNCFVKVLVLLIMCFLRFSFFLVFNGFHYLLFVLKRLDVLLNFILVVTFLWF